MACWMTIMIRFSSFRLIFCDLVFGEHERVLQGGFKLCPEPSVSPFKAK